MEPSRSRKIKSPGYWRTLYELMADNYRGYFDVVLRKKVPAKYESAKGKPGVFWAAVKFLWISIKSFSEFLFATLLFVFATAVVTVSPVFMPMLALVVWGLQAREIRLLLKEAERD